MTSIAVEQGEPRALGGAVDGGGRALAGADSARRTATAREHGARGALRRGWRLLCAWLALVLLLPGCGGGGGGEEPSAATPPVVTAPVITAQPTSVSAPVGATATFTVTATGGGLNYAWSRSTSGGVTWQAISGASGSSFTVAVVDAAMNGHQFRVAIQNGAGLVTSGAATLTVNGMSGSAPAITQQPTDQSVTVPAAATFTVAASGVPAPDYQWQLSTDGGTTFNDIAGATAASYTMPATSTGDSGRKYRVVVSNTSGSVMSDAVTLTVNAGTGGGGGGTGTIPTTCVPANVLPAGMVLRSDWALAVNGVVGTPQSATLTIVGASTFQGRAAFEAKLDTSGTFFPAITRVFSSYDTTSRLLTPYGSIVRLGIDPNNYTEVTIVGRQPARYPVYALAAGQSETVTATADTTMVTVVNGVAGAPATSTETTTTTYTFHGTETITVPGGTFLTCKVTEQVAGGSAQTNWLMVGYGVNVKTQTANTTQVLTAVSVNGTPLTRFP
ncbi:MAG: hypothetical protein HZC37_16250 [Burkholderiales bacterium]|nr:hypothetical protein [Burkholderiales bacterium]